MQITLLKSKIHRAVVTEARQDYIGSITIDRALMNAAGLLDYEKVLVANVTNGSRLETYVIPGEAESGVICLNGAAAHAAKVGDTVIIMAFAQMPAQDAKCFRPAVVFVNEKNAITRTERYEAPGTVYETERKMSHGKETDL